MNGEIHGIMGGCNILLIGRWVSESMNEFTDCLVI